MKNNNDSDSINIFYQRLVFVGERMIIAGGLLLLSLSFVIALLATLRLSNLQGLIIILSEIAQAIALVLPLIVIILNQAKPDGMGRIIDNMQHPLFFAGFIIVVQIIISVALKKVFGLRIENNVVVMQSIFHTIVSGRLIFIGIRKPQIHEIMSQIVISLTRSFATIKALPLYIRHFLPMVQANVSLQSLRIFNSRMELISLMTVLLNAKTYFDWYKEKRGRKPKKNYESFLLIDFSQKRSFIPAANMILQHIFKGCDSSSFWSNQNMLVLLPRQLNT